MRHALNVARADLRVKQDDLVTARSQEQQRRDREAKEGGKDKMLGRCWRWTNTLKPAVLECIETCQIPFPIPLGHH